MTHVLFAPDGHRRYAREERVSIEAAYQQGAKSLELTSDFFLSEGRASQLTYLITCGHTVERDDGTLRIIHQVVENGLQRLLQDMFFSRRGIQFFALIHGHATPSSVQELCRALATHNPAGTQKQIRLLFGYSIDQDERDAFDAADSFPEYQTRRAIPPIDLVLRSLEMRMSNGPTYACGQAQMITLPVSNPKTRREHLQAAWEEYERLHAYRRTSNPVHREATENL